MSRLRLLGVQAGRVAPPASGEREVMSGIRKRPVTGLVAVGVLEAGQAFELVAGPRQTPLTALFPPASGRWLIG